MNDDRAALHQFSGTTSLFPLPNLVFFPHVVQPLHIFEPRYRQMTADALASDRLFALVLPKSGWEEDYEGRPPIFPVACLGRIVADQLLPDGRYNLLLRGLSRIRILEELSTDKLYRVAKVELIEPEPMEDLSAALELRQRLSDSILPRFANVPLREQLRELFSSEMSISDLCDILGFALPIPVDVKQQMLEEVDVTLRVELLLEGFNEVSPVKEPILAVRPRKFPPDFSLN